MSMNHEKVFGLAKKDIGFNAALNASGQKMPTSLFSGTLEKGIWAAGYSGWILGTFGAAEHLRRSAEWRQL